MSEQPRDQEKKTNGKKIDWDNQSKEARTEATRRFYQMLEEDEELRTACTAGDQAASDTAHAKLKEAGNYANMPDHKRLEVRVVESDDAITKDGPLVLILLPAKGEFDAERLDIEATWRCTWSQWDTTKLDK